MREIKFRAWRKEYGMTNSFTLGNLQDNIQFDFHDGGYFSWNEFGLEHKDTALMQYTGLKDKNGVEIYEGDILDGVGVIKWHQQECCFTFGEKILEGNDDMLIENSVIIGNIYENPDLLKESANV